MSQGGRSRRPTTCRRCHAPVRFARLADSTLNVCLDRDSDPAGTYRLNHTPTGIVAARMTAEQINKATADGEHLLLFRKHSRSCIAGQPVNPRPAHLTLDFPQENPVTTTEPLSVTYLAPAELRAHPNNVRTDLGDLAELTASIRERGILQPLTVAPFGSTGKYRVIAGHRRLEAARRAQLAQVPCLVRADLTDPADQITAMLVENVHRADITVCEEADAYQALLDLGVDVKKVAARTGRAQKTVRERVKLAGTAPEVRTALTSHQITFEQALQVHDFAADTAVFERLCERMGTNDFTWELQRQVNARDRQKRVAEHLADFTARGVTILEDVPAHDSGGQYLSTLVRNAVGYGAAAPEELTPVGHESCPGHAVRVDGYGPDGYTAFCTTPDVHADLIAGLQADRGLTEPYGGRRPRGTDTVNLPVTEEEQALRDTRDDLQAAADVRLKQMAAVAYSDDRGKATTLVRRLLHTYVGGMADFELTSARVLLNLPADAERSAILAASDYVGLLQGVFVLAGVEESVREQDGWLLDPEGYADPDTEVWRAELTEVWGYRWSEVERRLLDDAAVDATRETEQS